MLVLERYLMERGISGWEETVVLRNQLVFCDVTSMKSERLGARLGNGVYKHRSMGDEQQEQTLMSRDLELQGESGQTIVEIVRTRGRNIATDLSCPSSTTSLVSANSTARPREGWATPSQKRKPEHR